MKVLYCAIGFCKNRNELRMKMYLSERRIQMIIKMANKFKLTGVHFARPNPMQIHCMCMHLDLPLDTKKLGHRAIRLPGHWAVTPSWATGPSGH